MSISVFSDCNRSLRTRRFLYFLITSLIGAGIGTLWVFYRNDPSSVIEGFYPGGLYSYLRTALVSLGPMIYYAKSPLGLADFLGGVYVALFFMGLWHFHKQKKYDLILFFLLVICVPIFIDYITLGRKGNYRWVRYLSHLIVPYLFVISCGIEYISGHLKYRILKIILVAMLFLCLSPGVLIWHQDAQRSRSSEMIQWTDQIVSMSSKLKGIIIYAKPEWPKEKIRIPSKYFLYRKDTLPVYFVNNGKLARIIGVPSLRNITTIPKIINNEKVELESGLYAIIYKRNKPLVCQGLSKELKEKYFISCRDDLSPPGSIIISHIAAKGPN